MSLVVPKDQCETCPKCGKRTAYQVDKFGWVRLQCDECGFDEMIKRAEGYSHREAHQMQLRGLV